MLEHAVAKPLPSAQWVHKFNILNYVRLIKL